MDPNQAQSGERKEEIKESQQAPVSETRVAEEPKPAVPKVQLPKFYAPKLPKLSEIKVKEKLQEYSRVLKVTKKPDMPEFKAIVRASGLGITIVGIVGFVIAMIVQVITIIA